MSEHVYASLIDESLKTGIDSGVEGRQLSLSMEYVMKTHGISKHYLEPYKSIWLKGAMKIRREKDKKLYKLTTI